MQIKGIRIAVHTSKPLASRKKAEPRVAKPAFCANHGKLSQVDPVNMLTVMTQQQETYLKMSNIYPRK
jgi:hypothetical protein